MLFFRPMLDLEASCSGSGEEETEGEFKTETIWFGLMRSVDPRVMIGKGERVDR
jgi:hypothetical protein